MDGKFTKNVVEYPVDAISSRRSAGKGAVMTCIRKLARKLFTKEIMLYLFFGFLVTVVNFAVFQGMLWLLGEGWHHMANVIAFVAAASFAYITNKLFVFESRSFAKNVLKKEIPAFFGARVVSFLFEEAGIFIMIDLLKLHKLAFLGNFGELAVKVVLAVVVIVLNYVFSKFFIFKNTGEDTR